jgi:RsiW-degrading membrane proteinase PrsW (M82 family)
MAETLLALAVGILPVLAFLAGLLAIDSYKLVRLRLVLATVAAGALVAVLCWFVNGWLIEWFDAPLSTYSRYGGPVVEEIAKGLVIVALIRSHRIGFLVDAAILGFAVGAGFAVLENTWYHQLVPDAGVGLWIVRGFGTAIMHGGVTAVFAMMAVALRERATTAAPWLLLPGLLLAILLHSAFNHMFLSPLLSTLAVLLVLPPLLHLVFHRSEAAVGEWLGRGLDRDAEMIELIGSGRFTEAPVGRYLSSLRDRFEGPIVADLLCYVRLHTELAMRAKGLMMMRESGFPVKLDEATRDKLVELRYLEKSIGRTGMLALRPLVHTSQRDAWQIVMLS